MKVLALLGFSMVLFPIMLIFPPSVIFWVAGGLLILRYARRAGQ